jgi:alanine racemase
MSRAARATIDLSALRHNLRQAKKAAPSTKTLAVIKANGYGHGISCVAKALDKAESFGVASVEEALVIRQAGIDKPIVLLEGFFSASELPLILQHNLGVVVHHQFQLEVLSKHLPLASGSGVDDVKLNVWLKVDTGMHRLGFAMEKIHAVWDELKTNPRIKSITLMTHLANADDRQDGLTDIQVARFNQCTQGLDAPRSIANSGGVLGWPSTHADIIRPGIMLYGGTPFNSGTGVDAGLKPVMTLQTQIIAVNHYKKGDSIGYGGTWTCPQDMTVGVAAIGYGDGYPRHADSGTPVLVNERRAQLVGRVSMDMICIDLRKVPGAQVGDPVILWGEGLPIEEIARSASTISYELFCGITQRVAFVVVNDGN